MPEFTDQSKNITIGVRRNQKAQNSVGPGEYNPKNELTKNRSFSAIISRSPPRFTGTEKASLNVSQVDGPIPDIAKGANAYTIGVRRDYPK